MSSSGPDTLHYSDIASMSRSRRGLQSPSGNRPDNSTTYPHHSSYDCEHLEVIENLEVHNSRLVRENDLLKEQVRLKEENLRLHGIHILSDVVHLLDEHHIKCNKHRSGDLSPPPIRGPSRPTQRQEKVDRKNDLKRPKSHSPYRQDIEEDHRLMAEMSRQTARSPTSNSILYGSKDRSATYPKPRCHFSPSIDSVELEDVLSKSVSLGVEYDSRVDRKAGTNCNVNGNHKFIYTDPKSYDLKSPATNNTSYFSNVDKNTQNLARHWERCDHKHLHVRPTDPRKKIKSRAYQSAHIRSRPPDLKDTYIIQDKLKTVHSPKTSHPDDPHVVTGGKKVSPTAKHKTGQQPAPLDSRSSSRTPEHDVQDMGECMSKPSRVSDTAIMKLSLLESNHTRVLGEIAFQLDKRILSFVLNGKFSRHCRYKSFYGYTVLNLQQRVIEREKGEMKEVMLDRYSFLMNTLQSAGYMIPEHSNTSVTLVNKYGVMKQTAADVRSVVIDLHDEALLRGIARRICPPEEIDDVLTLLQCLAVMAADDGMPLFIW